MSIHCAAMSMHIVEQMWRVWWRDPL